MDFDKNIRENCKIIETIASQYKNDSPEVRALKRVALAYIYVLIHHQQEFADYTKGQIEPLRKLFND